MARSRNHSLPKQIEAAEKTKKALRLKIEGKSIAEITKACGWKNERSTYTALRRALLMIPADEVEEYRTIHMHRLEMMWGGLVQGIRIGDPDSVRAGIQVLKRQATLLGLDAPLRIDVTSIAAQYAEMYNLTETERTTLFQAIKQDLARSRTAALPSGDLPEIEGEYTENDVEDESDESSGEDQ